MGWVYIAFFEGKISERNQNLKKKFNPFILVAPKTAWRFWQYLFNKSNFQKIFDEEMLFRKKLATFLQIFFQLKGN